MCNINIPFFAWQLAGDHLGVDDFDLIYTVHIVTHSHKCRLFCWCTQSAPIGCMR